MRLSHLFSSSLLLTVFAGAATAQDALEAPPARKAPTAPQEAQEAQDEVEAELARIAGEVKQAQGEVASAQEAHEAASAAGTDALEALEALGYVDSDGDERGYMGIHMAVENDAMVVRDVTAGGPAAGIGLEAGDRITSINGKSIAKMEDLEGFLTGLTAGETVELRIERGGWIKETKVELAARDAVFKEGASGPGAGVRKVEPSEAPSQGLFFSDESEENDDVEVHDTHDQGAGHGESDGKTWAWSSPKGDQKIEVRVDGKVEGGGDFRMHINGKEFKFPAGEGDSDVRVFRLHGDDEGDEHDIVIELDGEHGDMVKKLFSKDGKHFEFDMDGMGEHGKKLHKKLLKLHGNDGDHEVIFELDVDGEHGGDVPWFSKDGKDFRFDSDEHRDKLHKKLRKLHKGDGKHEIIIELDEDDERGGQMKEWFSKDGNRFKVEMGEWADKFHGERGKIREKIREELHKSGNGRFSGRAEKHFSDGGGATREEFKRLREEIRDLRKEVSRLRNLRKELEEIEELRRDVRKLLKSIK